MPESSERDRQNEVEAESLCDGHYAGQQPLKASEANQLYHATMRVGCVRWVSENYLWMPRSFIHSLKYEAVWHLAVISFSQMYVVIAYINTLILYLKKDDHDFVLRPS
eukprot:2371932-Amphidinium_carterae.1